MKTRLFQWSEEGGGEVAFDVVGQGRDALLLPAERPQPQASPCA